MAKLKIKKGDDVIVLAGKEKGKKGTVLRVIPKENRVVVQGLNMVKRHQKPGRGGPGGMVEKEGTIHVSNVALTDPKTGKATRVGYKFLEDGSKVRVARSSGEVING
jgi:large subunit ribosomal protein L24